VLGAATFYQLRSFIKMRKIRLVAISLFLVTVSAFSIFAQTPQNASFKVGLINTLAFDNEKAGIVKYATAMKSVETGFKRELDEINAMVVRLQNLEKELTALQKQLTAPTSPGVPVNNAQLQTSYNTKIEEYDKLGRDYKFKQEDVRARFQRRRQEVMGPILLDIGKAMQEFAKQKGFSIILDASKLGDSGVLLAIDDKVDLTKDFITFYNARPATAVVTTPVK
jgi:Skp family chaperone for outer membrane proteins